MEKRVVGMCYDYAHDGRGVVKVEKMPIFVEGLLKGEKAELEIIKQEKGYFLGKVMKRLNDSPSRVNPICPNYEDCGGCHLQHMNYQEQLSFKQIRVKEVLKRIGGIQVEVNNVLGMKDPYRYRNKVQVPFAYNEKKEVIAGFYKKGSHQIIDMKECFIEEMEADQILVSLKELFKEFDIEPYDAQRNLGTIRFALVRKSIAFHSIMVVLITRTDFIKNKEKLIEALVKKYPNIHTIVQNINTERTTQILGNKEHILYGSGYIEDVLAGLTFRISAKSFYQVNPVQTEVLYQKAIECAALTGKEIVLDTYCGVGTIGLIASKHAKHVIGVEIVKQAIENAKMNAKKNQIHNIQFECEDASIFMEKQAKNQQKVDIVFVDPPRNGCDGVFLKSLIQLCPQKIIYISCEPSSLARDLKVLTAQGYEVKEVTPVDMFPMTYHVETLCCLVRKS